MHFIVSRKSLDVSIMFFGAAFESDLCVLIGWYITNQIRVMIALSVSRYCWVSCCSNEVGLWIAIRK